jgi:hypothetical protein
MPHMIRSFLRDKTLAAIGFALAIVSAAAAGCSFGGSAGSLRAQSLGDDPVVLYGTFKQVYFSHDEKESTSFMLSDVPIDDLLNGSIQNGQLLHVRLLWMPKAGSTPMDSTATNASIRFVVIAGGEVGVYSGAGFAVPDSDLTGARAKVTLYDATVQLQDATAGFRDLLSPAHVSGSFTAIRDERLTQQMQRAASQLTTTALGKTRFVLAH